MENFIKNFEYKGAKFTITVQTRPSRIKIDETDHYIDVTGSSSNYHTNHFCRGKNLKEMLEKIQKSIEFYTDSKLNGVPNKTEKLLVEMGFEKQQEDTKK